jgi:hypothetical protein
MVARGSDAVDRSQWAEVGVGMVGRTARTAKSLQHKNAPELAAAARIAAVAAALTIQATAAGDQTLAAALLGVQSAAAEYIGADMRDRHIGLGTLPRPAKIGRGVLV